MPRVERLRVVGRSFAQNIPVHFTLGLAGAGTFQGPPGGDQDASHNESHGHVHLLQLIRSP